MQMTKTLSLAALALTSLMASDWDKKTTITINAPVQIPTTTLQPGTYTLKLMESTSDRHIVTVWDKDGMHLITTVIAIPNYRLRPTGESKFTFWETSSGEPAAMRGWFYPGDNFGQEFAYPKAKAQQLSSVSHQDVPSLSADEESKFGSKGSQMTATNESPATVGTATAETNAVTAPVAAPEPQAAPAATEPAPAPVTEAPVAAAPAPEPAPAPAAPVTTAAAEEQAPAAPVAPATEMPQTASNWNQTMSFGLLLSLTGLSTFLVKRKSVK